jgi:hypothetical protein
LKNLPARPPAAFLFASDDAAGHRPLMLRYLVVVAFLGCLGGVECVSLGGCAKPKSLPDITVRASAAGELTAFRSELGARFTPEQLQPFDTALQELKLDAMNRGVATAADREQDMLAAINGQTVHGALLLGWMARRNRILREIAFMTGQLEYNLKQQQQTAATGTPESVTTHLHNVQDILARLHRDLADAERRLTDWGAKLGTPPKT